MKPETFQKTTDVRVIMSTINQQRDITMLFFIQISHPDLKFALQISSDKQIYDLHLVQFELPIKAGLT